MTPRGRSRAICRAKSRAKPRADLVLEVRERRVEVGRVGRGRLRQTQRVQTAAHGVDDAGADAAAAAAGVRRRCRHRRRRRDAAAAVGVGRTRPERLRQKVTDFLWNQRHRNKKNSGLSQRTVKACTEIVTMNSTVFYCYKPNNCPNQIWKTLNSVQGTQVVVASRHHWFSIRQGRRPCRANGSEMGCSMSYIATNPTIALIRYGKR